MKDWMRNGWIEAAGGYIVGLGVYTLTSSAMLALAVPTAVMAVVLTKQRRQAAQQLREGNMLPAAAGQATGRGQFGGGAGGAGLAGAGSAGSAGIGGYGGTVTGAAGAIGTGGAGGTAAGTSAAAVGGTQVQPVIADPELAAAIEYIGILEDMIHLEGEKGTLDDEIVQKTIALLSRLHRLIPDLVTLNDTNINYNIVRLIRRDLNSTINPFLRLSGDAKRQNRRVLLDGIKDINSKLTFYTQTIEQKDLMELRTKADLIQQRYRMND
ncbi:hypothetical protein [Paenibacillus swuensis]|uniref:hypothetical protein n=1 Tax=Paenibacillus swuensis TaxID=1178515 RepID=UPI0008384F69|nr:hypothetical protein [Paenibacillus swuensis]